MNKILRYSKEIAKSYHEENGQYKIDVNSMVYKRKLGDRINTFFARYLLFVMNSNVISTVTKEYIKSFETNVADIVAGYNLQNEYAPINSKKMHNHLYYDGKKLASLFTEDMLEKLLFGKGDIVLYEAMLESAISQQVKESNLGKHSVLNIPNTLCDTMPSEKEIDMFFNTFATYTKAEVERVSKQLSEHVTGYFNYLLVKKELNPKEEELLTILKTFIQGIEIE